MTPKAVIETWVKLFNAADADGLARLYHPEAVNHQVVQAPVTDGTPSAPCSRRSSRRRT